MASGEMSPEAFQTFLQEFLRRTAQVVSDGGVLYVCIDWRHVRDLLEATEAAGLGLLNLCIWVKDNAGMGSFYRSQHELVVVLKKGQTSHVNNVQLGKFGRNRSNVWRYPGVNSLHPERRAELSLHPTVKPCEMVADAILDSTKPGDIILDPFLGSGTTVIACEKTGRVCRAMDLDPRYVDVAVRRWQAYVSAHAVHAQTDLTFDQMAEIRQAPLLALPPPSKPEKTEEG
jgi:DNA modification methylase